MPPAIGQLPEELLLAIVKQVVTIPVCSATPGVTRAAQLFDICLVSKRFARITEPVLYSSISIQINVPSVYQRLFCLLSALIQKPSRAKYIRYLKVTPTTAASYAKPAFQCYHTQVSEEEKLVLKQLASRFWRQPLFEDWLRDIHTGSSQAPLALLVKLTSQIRHLSILEPLYRQSALKYLLPDNSPLTALVSSPGFSKLTTLSLSGSEYVSELDSYVAQFLPTLPLYSIIDTGIAGLAI
jgi:hypothetical protein